MLDFVIFAISFVVFLLILVFYLYPGSSSKKTNVPGVDPSDAADGNIPDILRFGGLHPFLKDLHESYGSIASFWMGRNLVVSVSTPELFKEVQQAFNKPEEMFDLYTSLVGSRSLLELNGAEARKRRDVWKKFLDSDWLLPTAVKSVEELTSKLSSLPKGQHIPLIAYTKALCMRICCQIAFGDFFQDEQILKFSRIFETCWLELETQSSGSLPEDNSPRLKRFKEEVSSLKSALREALHKSSSSSTCFLKTLVAEGLTEEEAVNDALLFVVKFNSLSFAMTWLLYFISSNEDVQAKIRKEAKDTFEAKSITRTSLPKLRYIDQVVKESLRLSVIEPWTARYQELDVEIGGYIIPKKTPVILALGVSHLSDKNWSQPKQFNPDNFSKSTDSEAFLPFGATSGRRGCPGAGLATDLMKVLVTSLCSKACVELVEGQVISSIYSICTRPEDEVWVTITKC